MRVDHFVCSSLLMLALAATLLAASPPAYAQGGTTTTISGTVVDTSGGVIPGAEVTVKNNATGAVYTTVTAGNGTFSVPGLNPGSYSVTVVLMGFKTHTLPDVPVAAAVPAMVRPVLEVGNLEETVVVQAGAEIVQTASAAVATTLTVRQITNLPMTSREVASFVINMPGVDAASGVRDANVLGLPQGQVNITIDGINIQDNTLKTSDGMFSMVSPRLDAMEEMTFSTAASGADAASQGAVQMRFTTRSGSNNFVGSGYYYLQADELNTNSYFNKRDNIAKADMIRHQPGARLGGPLLRNRAFFFFNYEEYRQPGGFTTNSTLLHPRAQEGWFRYLDGSGNLKEINVYDEARKYGLTDTPDATVGKLLTDIRNSTATTGTITDLSNPLYQRYSFQQKSKSFRRYPTGRFDLNLTRNHRFSASSNYASYDDFPDTTNGYWNTFPGLPLIMGQGSNRYQYQFSVRSTLGTSLVNEARYGGSGGNVLFFEEYTMDMLTGPVANQDGFTLGISAAGITNAGNIPTKQARNAPQYTFEDSLTWLKGHHSFNFGALFTQYDYWGWMQTLAPSIGFGVVNGDPAVNTMFPGLSGSDLSRAQNLYAVLTGRVGSIGGNVRLDEDTGDYRYLGKGMSRARLRQLDFYAQDSWRMKPNLTLSLGVRYALQLPFTSLNSSYSTATMEDVWGMTGIGPGFVPSVVGENLGYLYTHPRPLQGRDPRYVELTKGHKSFATDINNLAPALGVNWMPTSTKPFLRWLLGAQGDSSITAGYSVAYQRPGLSDFTGVVGDNPGVYRAATRNITNGNLADPTGAPGGVLPVLLRDKGRLGPPTFPERRVYPMTPTTDNQVHIFDPNLRVPYAQTYSIGFQRAVSKTTALSVRYVGTRNRDGWTDYNYNDVNILETGFLDEFMLAQKNLQANIAANKGRTFAYTGIPGTSPLPIYLAFFTGKDASQAGDPASYVYNKSTNPGAANFGSSSFYNYLALTYPRPFNAAGTGSSGLMGTAERRANAIKAGLPANFFIPNPAVLGGAVVTGNGGYTKYNSIQVEVRRRLSDGLQLNASYVYGRSWGSSRYSFRVPRVETRQTGGGGGVEHALKMNWVYELPFGHAQRWGGNWGRLVDGLLGGWQFHGIGRIQSGRLVDFGNVRLMGGLTKEELQKLYKPWVDADGKVWPFPVDLMENTVKAYAYSAVTASGLTGEAPTGKHIAPAQYAGCIEKYSASYGECGTRTLVLTGPMFWNFDVSVAKRVRIKGDVNFDFRAEVFNLFATTVFSAAGNIGYGSTRDSWEINGTRLNGARTMQLVFRVNF